MKLIFFSIFFQNFIFYFFICKGSDIWKNSVNTGSKSDFFQSMITETGINNKMNKQNDVLNKSKKKKSDSSQIKAVDGLNGKMTFLIQNQIPTPVTPNSPMCFNTGFYFNNVPNDIHFDMYKQEELINPYLPNFIQNDFIKENVNVNEFNHNFNDFKNPNKQEGIKNKTPSQVKGLKAKNFKNNNKNINNNYPNENLNPHDLNNLNQKKITKESFSNINSQNNSNSYKNINQPNNISNSVVNRSHLFKNEIPIANQVYPQSQPNLIQVIGFPCNYNPNQHFINNSICPNMNNSNQYNPYAINYPNNANENSFMPNFHNYRIPNQNNFPINNLSNSNNHENISQKLETCNLTNNELFYAQNPPDGKFEKNEKKIQNQANKFNKKEEVKAKESNEIVNLNNFKDILFENDIANKDGNLLAFSKKLSTIEENKDGKSLIQNNYQVTIINGCNLNDNSEIKKNFNLEEKIFSHLYKKNNNKQDPEDLTKKMDSSDIKSNINVIKNKEFLNYFEDQEPTMIKQSKEEIFKNFSTSYESNNKNKIIEKEFCDFDSIMKKNSNYKTPNISSDYYAYKFTSGGESLKCDLNFDKNFYQSTRHNNNQNLELFNPLDEDDFKNNLENNSKKLEENQIRHTFKIIKGGCGSDTHINISQNENPNESFDKEFGDSYGPKKSMFIILI